MPGTPPADCLPLERISPKGSTLTSQKIRSDLRATIIRKDTQLRQELTGAFRAIGQEMKASHEDVWDDWTHQPVAQIGLTISPYLLSVQIRITGDNARIYQYVDEGTRPHVIRAKTPGGFLKFRLGYDPRTTPVAQAHVGSGRATGDWRQKHSVQHPGTDAREFTAQLRQEWRPEFVRQVKNAFARALRR